MTRRFAFVTVWVFALGALAATADAQLFFHATAHGPGAHGTMWITDARVFNPDAVRSIEVRLAFLDGAGDNSGASEVSIAIGPRQAVALDDLVGSVFGLAEAGAVRLASDSPFVASSRTYNIGDGLSGTYGQFIAAAPVEVALQQGVLLFALNDPATNGFRTNVGFVNPTLSEVIVEVKVRDTEVGAEIGSGTISLGPLGFRQINNVFDFVDDATTVRENAVVEFLATAPVLGYASVIDNTSGDAFFVTPSADSGTPTSSNNPPDGTIDDPTGDLTIEPGDFVTFAGSASDPDGDEVTVLWDFGDGATSTELDPGEHTFADAGVFTVVFTATDDLGLSDPTPDTRTITVVGANNPPDGTIDEPVGDLTVEVGEAVAFSGSVSDPDGDAVTVLWDFGDGTTSTALSPGSHTYASAGAYAVVFTATDDQGLSDPTPDTRAITVGNANSPPNGTISEPTGDMTIATGESVFFTGVVSDPDGDTISVLWDFGDGTTSSQLNPGTHTYSAAGVYSVVFTATDEHGLADPTPDARTITVEAANSPPNGTIAQPPGDVTITAGESVTFAGSVTDPDGDTVTVLWDFGDGVSSTQLNPGTHTYASAGVFTATFTATDEHGMADPTPDSRTITVNAPSTTLTQIQGQIFTPQCVTCHGGGSPTAGLNLQAGQAHSNLVNVPAQTRPGTRVIPFDPDNSVLIQMLEDGHRSLPAAQILLIRDWIDAGALDN